MSICNIRYQIKIRVLWKSGSSLTSGAMKSGESAMHFTSLKSQVFLKSILVSILEQLNNSWKVSPWTLFSCLNYFKTDMFGLLAWSQSATSSQLRPTWWFLIVLNWDVWLFEGKVILLGFNLNFKMVELICFLTPNPPADSPVNTKCVASNKLKWWLRWFITFLKSSSDNQIKVKWKLRSLCE